MPRFVGNGLLALSLLVFAACGDSTGPGPRTVEEARALWASHHLTTYSYFGSQACFCGAPSGLVRVEVTDGRVSSVTDWTTQAQIATTGWLTVDQLLDLAGTLQPSPVEFDWYLGFPRKVERCCIADDSGSVYTVAMLILLPT
jgi:hypothetical protein